VPRSRDKQCAEEVYDDVITVDRGHLDPALRVESPHDTLARVRYHMLLVRRRKKAVRRTEFRLSGAGIWSSV
jgi:hypothetical protein